MAGSRISGRPPGFRLLLLWIGWGWRPHTLWWSSALAVRLPVYSARNLQLGPPTWRWLSRVALLPHSGDWAWPRPQSPPCRGSAAPRLRLLPCANGFPLLGEEGDETSAAVDQGVAGSQFEGACPDFPDGCGRGVRCWVPCSLLAGLGSSVGLDWAARGGRHIGFGGGFPSGGGGRLGCWWPSCTRD